MALGPRLDIRQTQALVLTPQLQQAIRLLQLSNLELEAVIAEEMAKNPLLEAASGDDEAGPPPEAEAEIPVDSLEEPAAPGADELMVSSDATSDQPLDFDWNSEALETDSFSDAAVSSGSSDDDGPDFERMEYAADSLSEHLLDQLHGAGGQVGTARARDRRDARRDGLPKRPGTRHCRGNRRADRGRRRSAGPSAGPGPGRSWRSQPCRMPCSAGQGGRPLRPGDGEADRQSRSTRKGPDGGSQADLRGR